jgi:RNA polymerase sigma-70 factor, ECF subfamily
MNTKIASLPGRFVTSHNAANGITVFTNDKPDFDLIKRISAGDQLAMKVLYTRHKVRVYRFALRIVRDEALADDLVNEVFFHVWKKADAFEGRSQVSTWLLAIARNLAVAMVRRRSTEVLDENAYESVEDMSDDPETAMHKKQRGSIFADCIANLSPRHREIVDLVYYHEKSVDEAAEILGVSSNTVKTRMFYARRRLAESLTARGVRAA